MNGTDRQIVSPSAAFDPRLAGQTSSLQSKGGAIYDRRQQPIEPTPGPYTVKVPKVTAGFHVGDRQREQAKDTTPASNAYTSKSNTLSGNAQTFGNSKDLSSKQ